MGILVLVAAVLALVFPDVLQQIRPTVINYLLGVVMFGMGLTLNLQDFKIVFSRPKDVIIGCLAQFTIMPLLAWGLAWTFQLDEALALGVVLVGCCPGGTASNVITYLAKGDLALSVGMTGVSTLLAPFMTPLLTWALAGKSVNVNVVGMLLSILWVVILPIVIGLEMDLAKVHREGDGLPAGHFDNSHLTHRGHHHWCQCRQAIGWRTDDRLGSRSPQPLRTQLRLSDRTTAQAVGTQEASHLHRGGYAELWTGQQPGHNPLCRLPSGHNPWRPLQRMA